MKLRTIRVDDVRRFADPVRIDGIADGVNVLAAPNEFGKSTLFDALRALFFVPHGSRAKEISQLRPHAGGAPAVSVEIETAEGRFTVSKRWFMKPEARVTRGGVLIAQADEAEAWIARLLGGGDGGPSGLLWVRQGLAGLSDGSNAEQKAALEARRDLLSSVTGEVEAMTGGRRMDAVLGQCEAALAAYATSTGRPRTPGPWKAAIDEVEELRSEREAQSALVTQLQEALDERGRLRRELAELEAPEAARERTGRREAAQAAHEAALAHAARVEAAERAVETARAAAAQAQAELETLQSASAASRAAEERLSQARHRLSEAEEELAGAESDHLEIARAHEAADRDRREAEELLARVHARAGTLAASERRAELQTRLEKALEARGTLEAAEAEASVRPDDRDMERLLGLSGALATARALRDSTATRVRMRYAPGREGALTIDGAPLAPDGDRTILFDSVVVIDGVGELTIHPGDGLRDAAEADRAESRFSEALAALGVGTMEEAVAAHQRRMAARDRRTQARADLAALAPDGIEALQRQLAALPQATGPEATDLPPLPEAEARAGQARSAASGLWARLEAARERRDARRTARAEAIVRCEAASEMLASARATLDRLAGQEEGDLAGRAARTHAAAGQAEAALAGLRAEAPDLEATAAALARARSIEEAARKRAEALRPALAALDERVASRSGEAVEERLRETEERLEEAEARLSRIAREVRVLQKLRSVLETARSEARDRYFEPVARELRPLLHLLWPEAELDWADDTLLPQALIRDGQTEALDILSGGTQEQIALLVRLAFARLLSRDGRHAPVILDDALVFTDDDRIERMFDALHRQASDLQIIVLSCRQRAFRDLGGTTLEVRDDPQDR